MDRHQCGQDLLHPDESRFFRLGGHGGVGGLSVVPRVPVPGRIVKVVLVLGFFFSFSQAVSDILMIGPKLYRELVCPLSLPAFLERPSRMSLGRSPSSSSAIASAFTLVSFIRRNWLGHP